VILVTDDGTVVLAIAGIAGTLLAAILSPLVAGRVQRKARKAELMMKQRLSAYTDLLEICRYVRDNLQTRATFPLANDIDDPSVEDLRRIEARIRVAGSDRVREAMNRVSNLASRFGADLFPAQLQARRAQLEELGDTEDTIRARFHLGGIADEVANAVNDLEAVIRKETRV
jgi:type II secretory pathway pseudopilin PulG